MTRPSRCIGVAAATLLLGSLLPVRPASAQLVWDDLVFTGGVAVESYDGNFSSVTVPVVDSVEHASATIGEFATRGGFHFPDLGVWVRFDGGIRQFAANGFEIRDFAPREWAGRVDVGWSHHVGDVGQLQLTARARGRDVEDRPPLPLFLQPGHDGIRLSTFFRSAPVQEVRFDVQADLERTDYDAPDLLPQLDLLDRRSWGFEVGTAFGPLALDPETGGWRLRFFTAFRKSQFRDQASFDPSDPFRRDRTVQVGGVWSYEGPVLGEVGIEGTVNRSNSRRPEYDAVSVRGDLWAPLPWWELSLNVLAVVTGKSYVSEVPFARLVPGEEADNASVVFLDLNRPIAPTLDGALRLGWTRAETDFGDTYYSRFGLSFLVNYRPVGF